jgi:Tfp pilus assembly protein PilO
VKRNEQIILGSIAILGLIAAFWLLALSTKRKQASELQSQVEQLQSSLTQAQQDISAGEQARKSFSLDYRRLVVLGKAVPADSEQTSLFVQLQNLADRSGVGFQSIDLGEASSAAASTPAPSTSTSTTSTSTSSTDASGSSTDTSLAAPASEASVSMLPIGAAVGPAGLPVMPYSMSFTGDFFQIADFMKRLDGLVHIRGGVPDVRGRLLTVDGFTLTPAEDDTSADPELTVDLSVTTFLTPSDQGITAGATPSGPAPATPTLTSSSTPTDTTSTTGSTTSTSTETTTSSTTSP